MDALSFGKNCRLRKSYEFASVTLNGNKVYGRYITIYRVPSKTNSNSARIGITVSKKVHKRSVRRNRIKRLVREVFRTNKDIFCVTSKTGVTLNYDYVIIARKRSVECTSVHEMKDDVLRALFFFSKRSDKSSKKKVLRIPKET